MKRNTGNRSRWFVSLLFFVGIAAPALALPAEDTPADLLKLSDEMTQKVIQLRGLAPTGPIQKGVKSRTEIAQFLNNHIRASYAESQLQGEGKLLRTLGLIPAGLNYGDFMLKLLTEQVGGYYDPEKGTFFIAAWLPGDQQKPVMVHELTHAIEDQHFHIGRVMEEDRKLQNDDRLLAHMALFEGDATAVMLDSLLEPAGRNFSQLPDIVFVMRSQYSSLESQFDVFRQAPDYIKESLVFPYAYGATFLQKARATQPWTAVDKIYADLPASTEQIMHPEKYFGQRDNPVEVEIEDPSSRLGDGWKVTYRNVLGEFTLQRLLRTHLAEERSKNAAAGWGGDKVLLVEGKDGAAAVFGLTVWDSPADAEEFYQAMTDWLAAQYPKAKRVDESANGFALVQSAEYHSLKIDGSKVQFVLGLPESESPKLRASEHKKP